MWELFFSHHITYLTFTSHHLPHLAYTGSPSHIPHMSRTSHTFKSSRVLVYLQLNKKKAKAEGKKCHAKTMWSQ